MTLKRIVFLCFAIILWSQVSTAQYLHTDFARHLTDNKNFQEVVDLTEQIPDQINGHKTDSLRYYRAWALYNLKMVPEAIENFRLVDPESKLFTRAMFFSSWCALYLKNYQEAERDLALIQPANGVEIELVQVIQSGLHLLNQFPDSAVNILSSLQHAGAVYQDQIDILINSATDIKEFKPKSMALAGLLSGVIPGLGKIYAREKGAGIGNILLLSGMGGMAVENILKSGIASWNGLIFTGLFTVFYLGNVYGSIISIKTYRERFYEQQEKVIVATLLIPLRDYYR